MKEINEENLCNINGGISGWTILGIGAAIVLAIGIFDGYTRPLGCNK